VNGVNVLLLQLDGTGANLALMRLAAHHRRLGDRVELRRTYTAGAVERQLGDAFDRVYASTIFHKTRAVADRVKRVYPDAAIGGTGWAVGTNLATVGVETRGPLDYSDYPRHTESIGFTQRGCRLSCKFCGVPLEEGRPVEWDDIPTIYRGEPWPRNILLLDNDFFGVPSWPKRIAELQAGNFKVSFNQGINARMLSDEAAAAIASVRYSDRKFTRKRIYTAWDNLKDEDTLFRGMEALVRHGVKPDEVMVYVLIGYDHKGRCALPRLTPEDFYRTDRLREFGARPYPMPYVLTDELRGFARWHQGGYHKTVPWAAWVANRYRPEGIGRRGGDTPLFPEDEPCA